MNYETLDVRLEQPICFIRINRPGANNTINDSLVSEFQQVLALCEESITVIVIEGLPEVFCFGADFNEIHEQMNKQQPASLGPEPLYDIWQQLAAGPYVSVAHVRGKVNAGGVGFVAACDIVIADETVLFSLSELLFGLFPACVLPFLVRRVGFQRAHYLTLMTKPVSAEAATAWGLVDVMGEPSERLLRTHLGRLKCLSKTGISRYKKYMNTLKPILREVKPTALAANLEVFSDPVNLAGISRYVETGQFPWES